MDRQEFMGKLYKSIQDFESHWNQQQRENPEDWPNEMEEAEWWEQAIIWLENYEGS